MALTNKKNNLNGSHRLFLLTMQYGIYLLAIFLFTDRGESFRSIGLYLPPVILVAKCIIDRKVYLNYKNPIFISLLALCLSAIISSFFATSLIESLHWFKRTYLKVFFIFTVIAYAFNEKNKLSRLIVLFAFLTILFTFFTFYDFFTKAINGNHVVFDRLRPYGISLPFFLPFVPYAIVYSKKNIFKIFWIFTIITASAAIMLTGFRGAWFSGAISLTIWGIWYVIKRKSKTLFFALLISISILLIALYTILPIGYVKMRIHMGLSSHGRYEWRWKAYYQMFYSFPVINKIFGKGLTKKEMYSEYNIWYKQKTGQYPSHNWARNPHNNYLSFLYKQGIIGLVLYISLLIITIYMILRKIKLSTNLEVKAMGIAILCPLISEYSIRAIVEDMRFMPLGVLLGLAVAYFNMEVKQQNEFKDYLSSSRTISR